MSKVRRSEGTGNHHNKQQLDLDNLKKEAKEVKHVQVNTVKRAAEPLKTYVPKPFTASIKPKGTIVTNRSALDQTSAFFDRVKNQ